MSRRHTADAVRGSRLDARNFAASLCGHDGVDCVAHLVKRAKKISRREGLRVFKKMASNAKADEGSVRVAVRVRPLSFKEKEEGSAACATVRSHHLNCMFACLVPKISRDTKARIS